MVQVEHNHRKYIESDGRHVCDHSFYAKYQNKLTANQKRVQNKCETQGILVA